MPESDKQIEGRLASVKASLAMEGLNVTADEEAIGRRFLKGEITEEQALELIQKL